MTQKILAIDDEPDILRLLDRIIREKTPYKITTTNNSLELPGLLANEEYDIILTDLKMPGMDGLDILKYIKDNNRFEQVVIITAFGSLDTATEAVSKGVFDYIVKPFRKEQILFTLDRAMRFQQAAKEIQKIRKIIGTEPYSEAEKEFKRIYIQQLRNRHNNDVESAADASGLKEEEILNSK